MGAGTPHARANLRSDALILPLYVIFLKSARLCSWRTKIVFPENLDCVPGEPRLCSGEPRLCSRRTSSWEPEQLPCCVEADLWKITYIGSISVSDLTFSDKLVKLVDTLFKGIPKIAWVGKILRL